MGILKTQRVKGAINRKFGEILHESRDGGK